MRNAPRQRQGFELVFVLVLMGMLSVISLAILQMVVSQNILSSREVRQQQIFNIAEAGINYYRWHLAHYPNDYKDGTTSAGPYVHDFKDASGKTLGQYALTITAPVNGSSITTIQSVGYLLSNPNAKHTVTVKLGIPSLSKYAVVANDFMRFGSGTEVFGPIHSNGGVHFDGVAHGLVSSAQSTYSDPDGYGTKPGVWSLINPDTSVFLGGKQYPVAPVNFNGITTDLAALKTAASSAGIYLAASGKQGYHLTLRTDGKVDMRIVNVEQSCQYRSGTGSCSVGSCTHKSCSNNRSKACNNNSQCGGGTCDTASCTSNSNCPTGYSCAFNNSCTSNGDCSGGGTCENFKDYGYCSNNFTTLCTQDSTCGNGNTCILASHSIGTDAADQSAFTYNGNSSLGVTLPANGIIFASDDLWVDGHINGSRVTIVAAKDPIASGKANIYINKDLRYTNMDGTDVIGLIAQNDILAGFFSADTFEVDAALIAQNGRVGRPYLGSSFTSSTNNSNFRIFPIGETNPSGGTTCQEFRKRSSITLTGSMATNQRYGFAWVGNVFSCGGGNYNNSGYCDRILNFDSNLVFSPPPSFPTTGEYSIISYTEK